MRAQAFLLVLAGCSDSGVTQLALDSAPFALAGPSVVPLLDGTRPVVALRLDGRELAFLVDSGSPLSLVDPRKAEELGLAVRPCTGYPSTSGSGGGSVPIDRCVPVERLELGALALEHARLAALDDDVLRGGLFSGILGQDLLARLVLVLDMEGRELHLLPETDRAGLQAYLKEAELGLGAWAVVPADFRPSPFLRIDAGAALPKGCEMELDTGTTDTTFPERLVAALELPEADTGTVELRGLGGSRASRAYRLQDFGLFGFRVTTEIYTSARDYALLGMDILGEFVLVLDGPGKSIWLHNRELEPDTSVMPVEGGGR